MKKDSSLQAWKVVTLKDVELKLISELMKDSRRSDRELASVLNVSQPTVSRTRERLVNEGYVREFTAIPDFQKLGFEIASIILVSLRKSLSERRLRKLGRSV
jgi:DNA-binding Lrp family transcriptional regulator